MLSSSANSMYAEHLRIMKVLMGMEQEHKVTEDAGRAAEQDAAAQRHAAEVLQLNGWFLL